MESDQSPPGRLRKVACSLPTDFGFIRDIQRGLAQFARSEGAWILRRVRGNHPELAAWKPDGVVAHLSGPASLAELAALGVPIVNTSSVLLESPVPRVRPDDYRVGCMAAEHFLERQFDSFAFCGDLEHRYALDRLAGFTATVSAAGGRLASIRPLHPRGTYLVHWQDRDRELLQWLRALPRPTGLLCVNDAMAERVLDICRQGQVRVPEHLAIVGVDDDEFVCESTWPPLSSVRLAGELIGRRAGELLERMMRGEQVPPRDVLLGPLALVSRHSSDVTAMEDPDLAAAVRCISDQIARSMDVADIAEAVGVSRRVLEEKFIRLLGRTPLAEIERVRLREASLLLVKTDWPIAKVARSVGLRSADRLGSLFRRKLNTCPREYRRQFR